MLRFLTAGESHGQALVVIVEGLPSGLAIDPAVTAADLKRRQGGYGRGRRMAIESDTAEVLSGIRKGETLGGPVALLVRNRDWTNWQNTMYVGAEPPADATGARKAPGDAAASRPRRSRRRARSTSATTCATSSSAPARARPTMRVAAGALARQLLARFGVEVVSHVFRIGPVGTSDPLGVTFADAKQIPADSPLHCADREAEARMIAEIDAAQGSRQHARRRLRGDRARRAGRPRQPRALGSQARWTPGAGADVDSRDQGGRHRHRPAGRGAARLRGARRDRAAAGGHARARPRRRTAPPTAPAASRAASPTARTSASPAT